MRRFCANLSTLFLEHPPIERPAAARRAGFTGAEFQFPYDIPAQALARAAAAAGIEIVNFNAPCGDRAGGEIGIACLPGREAEFRDAIATARAYAGALGCKRVNVLMGIVPADVERERCLETLARNLDRAATEMADAGILLITEPMNRHDRPGYCINKVGEAGAFVRAIGNRNLRLEVDVYHMAREDEAVAETLRANIDMIGHIQFADVPGRHEPGTGSLDLAGIFDTLEGAGYTGWLSAEYNPAGRTEDGLGWLDALARGG